MDDDFHCTRANQDVYCRLNVESYIQDFHILDMHWKQVSIEPGKPCNSPGWKHEIIRGFVAAYTNRLLVIGFGWIGRATSRRRSFKKAGRPQQLAYAEDVVA